MGNARDVGLAVAGSLSGIDFSGISAKKKEASKQSQPPLDASHVDVPSGGEQPPAHLEDVVTSPHAPLITSPMRAMKTK